MTLYVNCTLIFKKFKSLSLAQNSNGSFSIHLKFAAMVFPPHTGATSILVLRKLLNLPNFSKSQFTEQYSELGHIRPESPHPPVIQWE